MSPALRRPEPITDRHDINGFDCGNATLNAWLVERALDNELRGATRTFVATRGRSAVGYYSLAVSSLHRRDATGRVRRNTPEPIPAMLLARLAVDRSAQREGLGRQLLRDAMLRTLDAAEIAGIRILLVHAIDEPAKAWYRQFDFEESPTDPLQLMLLLEDLRYELQ
ncbi:MAG: GNAT family N-acetyltransferase [Acidimicrobiia bacterium]